jgi:hypothetical protein
VAPKTPEEKAFKACWQSYSSKRATLLKDYGVTIPEPPKLRWTTGSASKKAGNRQPRREQPRPTGAQEPISVSSPSPTDPIGQFTSMFKMFSNMQSELMKPLLSAVAALKK